MIPARMCLESLDRRPGIREQPGSIGVMLTVRRSTPVYPEKQTIFRTGWISQKVA